MKKQKIRDFVKDHKKELLAGLGGIAIGVCAPKIVNRYVIPMVTKTVRQPGFTIKGGLTIGDIGKLGEEYMKHDPELTKNTRILEVGTLKFE